MIAAAAVVAGMVNVSLAAFFGVDMHVAVDMPFLVSVIGYFALEPCNRMYTQTHKH